MKRSKILFLVFAGIFFLLLLWVSYDISRRTTFPGSKPQLQERLKGEYQKKDSAEANSSDRK